MPEILHIDLDGFFVAVERQLDPSLRDRPVIIGGQPATFGCVVAASAEAARRGVRPGLSLAIAAQRCPDAVFLDGAVDRYLEASAAVDEILRDPTLVGDGVPVEWTAIDAVCLDLTGTAARLGPGRRLAELIQERIARELGFDAACGLAGSRIAAQLAARLSRPRGLLYVLPCYEARLLSPLDVSLLPDLGTGARQRLAQEGICTLGQLATLDSSRARELIGNRGPTYVAWARGEDPRPVDGSRPPRSLAREVTLLDPDLDEVRLTAVVAHMAETLAVRLRQMGWFASTVTLRIRHAPAAPDHRPPDARPWPLRDTATYGATASYARNAGGRRTESRSLTLREATAADEELRTTALALFRTLWRRRPLAGLGIVLSNLQRSGPQMPLFPVSSLGGSGFRTRAGMRGLVEGRYLQHQRPRTRPAQRRAG